MRRAKRQGQSQNISLEHRRGRAAEASGGVRGNQPPAGRSFARASARCSSAAFSPGRRAERPATPACLPPSFRAERHRPTRAAADHAAIDGGGNYRGTAADQCEPQHSGAKYCDDTRETLKRHATRPGLQSAKLHNGGARIGAHRRLDARPQCRKKSASSLRRASQILVVGRSHPAYPLSSWGYVRIRRCREASLGCAKMNA
jgi:hypothetical protein